MDWTTPKQLIPFKRVASLLLIVLFTSAASNQATIAFVSNPPGGLLIHGGNNRGRMPLTRIFNIPLANQQDGKALIAGGRVQWPNGSITNFENFYIDLQQYSSFTYEFDQGTMERQKQAALNKCYEDLRASQAYCTQGSSNYNSSSCNYANIRADKSCYVNAIADLRCGINEIHEKIVCPNGKSPGRFRNSSASSCSMAGVRTYRCYVDRKK